MSCQSSTDLERFYKNKSLGEPETQAFGEFTFVQTFPYSGAGASHLYIYVPFENRLRFHQFLYLPDHRSVALNLLENGVVEVSFNDRTFAAIVPVNAN